MKNFACYMMILEALTTIPTGATAGMVSKRVGEMGCKLSPSQTRRRLQSMEHDGVVHSAWVKYRGDMLKHVYHITETAAMACAAVSTGYAEMEKQLALQGVQK